MIAALFEHVFMAGVARGVVDLDSLVKLVRAAHPPANPLAPSPLSLSALAWAHSTWPKDVDGTLWIGGDEEELTRIGPNEWTLSASLMQARELVAAAAIFAASSLTLREHFVDDAFLHGMGALETAALAERLQVDKALLAEYAEQDASFIARISRLAHEAFAPRLHIHSPRQVSTRAEALWQEVLAGLSEVGADTRPLAIWVAPLWVSEIVSPYAREVGPLLQKWAEETAGLPALADRLASGDADAAYWCAALFVGANASVREEKENAEAQVGIYALNDPSGVCVARIIDAQRLDPSAVDQRLGDLSHAEAPAPIVLLLAEDDPDIGYTLQRLLCEVSASFVRVSICASALSDSAPLVATARAAESSQGPIVLAAPALDLPIVPVVAVPSTGVALACALGASAEQDVVVSEARLQQAALAEALLRGDWSGAPTDQRLWSSRGETTLDERRAHSQDALSIWRSILAIAPEPRPRAPEVPREPPPEQRGRVRVRV